LRQGTPADAPILNASSLTGGGNSLTLTLKSTPNLVGYETAWCALQPKNGRIGFAIAPLAPGCQCREFEQKPVNPRHKQS
jgi:hypothetical protein